MTYFCVLTINIDRENLQQRPKSHFSLQWRASRITLSPHVYKNSYTVELASHCSTRYITDFGSRHVLLLLCQSLFARRERQKEREENEWGEQGTNTLMFCTCSDDSTRTLPAVQRRRSSSYLRRKNKNKKRLCYNGVVDVLPVGTVGSSVAQVLD